MNPQDNEANQHNPNKGTPGTNRQYDQVQGNRGKQLNPNQKVCCPTCGSSELNPSTIGSGYNCKKCHTSFR
jgi:uncharacterized protein (DUF983 family)